MLRRALVLLAACSPDPSNRPPPTDAVPDAACSTEGTYASITAMGTSPAGPFSLHSAQLVFAYCGVSYMFFATEKAEAWSCASGTKLALEFRAHHQADDALVVAGDAQTATARFYGPGSDWTTPSAETMQVEFRAEALDDYRSTTSPLHVKGRYVSTAPGWSFDIAIDADVTAYDTCL